MRLNGNFDLNGLISRVNHMHVGHVTLTHPMCHTLKPPVSYLNRRPKINENSEAEGPLERYRSCDRVIIKIPW